VTGAGHSVVDIGASADLELVDEFCYLGDMLCGNGEMEMLVQLCRPESGLDGVNSGS